MYDPPAATDDAELEELLRGGLGDVGEAAGRLGGGIGGGLAGRIGGARGGRFGARLGARLIPTRHHEQELELLALPLADAARLASEVLAHHGRAVWTREALGGLRVRGVIGSGALDRNPAVVDVHVRPGGRVLVHAAAKEGLIPQRTAQKAVRRIVESLRLAAATYSAAPPS